MNIKIAAAAAAVCLGAAACEQGDRQVADRDAAAETATRTPDSGAATEPAAGRPAPASPSAVTDTPKPGTTPGVEDDDLGQSSAANAVQDAAAGVVGQANAAVVGGDTEGFLRNAALGDLYEIRAGEIAQEKSQSDIIREIAQRIVADHEQMSADLKKTATQAGIVFAAPAILDERRQGLIDNLEAASPADFDEVYLDQQEDAHEEALTLLRSYVSRGDEAALKAAAQGAIPIVEAHLTRVQAAQEALEDAE